MKNKHKGKYRVVFDVDVIINPIVVQDRSEETEETVTESISNEEVINSGVDAVKCYLKKHHFCKTKKVVKKIAPYQGFGSLYNPDLGGFAIDDTLIDFTVAGPDFKTKPSVPQDFIKVKKDGVYLITFFMDIQAEAAFANFAIFVNNQQVDVGKFSFTTEGILQTTAGKTIQLELEEGDRISVKTINTGSPMNGYFPPPIRYTNAALTVTLLKKD
ncbi:hypothetical protein SLL00_10140 [Metabacillus indicus]|uniref:hypothetical protein n=1 Tax=Metabacillus indicus TaxID=246786 RepID=UPI002A08BDAD|nr:hypothetical protein [Metabacillus indicus]MDX8290156.1 hypothetical protein [Metabacillus indicus]